MHNKKQLFAVVALSLVAMLLLNSPQVKVDASDSDYLQDKIAQEQRKLDKTAGELESAQIRLDKLDNKLSKVTERLPQIELELQRIKVQIAYNKLQLAYLDDASNIAELRYQQQKELQELLLKASYSEWKLSNDIQRFLPSQQQTHYLKQDYYRSKLISRQSLNIADVHEDLVQLEADYAEFADQLEQLQVDNTALQAKRTQLKQELAMLKGDKSKLSGQVAGLYTRQQSISAQIARLNKEQQSAARRESDIIEKKPTPPPPPPAPTPPPPPASSSSSSSSSTSSTISSSSSTSSATNTTTSSATSSSSSKTSSATNPSPTVPTFKFRSHGRDYYQGHGVGMSQFGAHGMAQKGLSAEEILKNYYKGVEIVDIELNEQISIKYCANNPAKDPYQDGCADGKAPVVERVNFNKYLAGLGEMMESWPTEARKAQIIAARTYAVLHTANGNPNRPICITSYCQVSYIKNNDQGEMSLVEETADKVIRYNGQLIDALYSADNSQGRGTANNDTIFQNFYGDGTPYPYLRAFDDSQWATPTFYTNWSCTTNSYGMGAITKMLNYMGKRGQIAQSTKDRTLALANKVGSVTNITIERDPSQRVKKVYITGTNGNGVIGGWWFKYLWNEWVYATNRTNSNCFGEQRYDYIYSQTIFKVDN